MYTTHKDGGEWGMLYDYIAVPMLFEFIYYIKQEELQTVDAHDATRNVCPTDFGDQFSSLLSCWLQYPTTFSHSLIDRGLANP